MPAPHQSPRSGAPAPNRWPLRTQLAGLLALLGLWAFAFPAVLVFRMQAAVGGLLANSHTAMAGWTTRTRLENGNRGLLRPAETLLREAAEGMRPDSARLAATTAGLRSLADSAWAEDLGRALAAADGETRLEIALVTRDQHAAVAAVLEAANDLERGRFAFAARALARADSLHQAARDRVYGIERPALFGVFTGERAVLERAAGMRRLLIGWVLGGSVLLVVLLWLVRRRLYLPLARLEAGIASVAAGRLDVTLPVGADDELGRLTGIFNDMASATAERLDTPTRQAEVAAARLGRLLAASPDEIFLFEADSGRLVQASHGALSNIGLATRDLAGRTFVSLLPEFTPASLAQLLAPLRSGASDHVDVTTHLRRRDGSLYPADIVMHYAAVEDPPVVMAMARDISERVRLQVELDRLFDLSSDLVAAIRTDGSFVRINHAWGDLLGMDPREVEGRSLFDWLHPGDAPKLADALRRLLGGQALRDVTLRLRPRDTRTRWVAVNWEPPVDGVVHAVGREVTEAKEQEALGAGLRAAIARAAREWTQTVDAIDDPILLLEDTLRLVRMNEAARRIADRRHDELIGRFVEDLGDHPLWAQACRLAAEALATGRRASVQMHRNGSEESWDVQALPLRLGTDGTRAVILVAHDVTRVVTMQEEVQRSKSMAAMGELLAGVAHEVRNPLFSMTATIDAFAARHGGQAGGQHIEVLRSQVERITRLMSDLLDYGRPRALERGSVLMDDLLQQAVDAVRAEADEARAAIVLDGPGRQHTLVADRHRMIQVFVNLLSNAVAHAPKDSTVTVTVEPVQRQGRAWLDVAVRDAGPGFAADDLTRVFAPFFSRRRGGTGLGLAIVRRAVEQHGGQVRAENATSGGAVVRVRLPLDS